MANLFKQHKTLAFLVIGLVGILLLVFAYFFIYQPSQGPVFYDYAAPQIGVAVDRKRVVADVLPGSPAEAAGILRGDVFMQVGATTITPGSNLDLQATFQQEISAKVTPIIDAHVSGNFRVDTLPVVVSRNGQTLNFVVRPASPPFNFTLSNQIPITATAVPVSADWIYI